MLTTPKQPGPQPPPRNYGRLIPNAHPDPAMELRPKKGRVLPPHRYVDPMNDMDMEMAQQMSRAAALRRRGARNEP